MKIAHLSDTHLGFSAYSASYNLVNQRTLDVQQSFAQTLDAIAAREPDLVIHAGDLFHFPRPANNIIIKTFTQLHEFQAKRGFKPMVMVAGNHDSARTINFGNILDIFRNIKGVHVVTDNKIAVLEGLKGLEAVRITAVTSDALRLVEDKTTIRPRIGFHNILVLHGMAAGALSSKEQVAEFNDQELLPSTWTYVALGDYHKCKLLAPNMYYSGSTDYTSSNIWDETDVPKSWVMYDIEAKQAELIPVNTKRIVSLPPIFAADMDLEQVTQRMLTNADFDDRPIARQVVFGLRPEHRRLLQPTIKCIAENCQHYEFTLERPKFQATEVAEQREKVGNAQAWKEHIEQATLKLGLDRELVISTGQRLLEQAEEIEQVDGYAIVGA